MSKAWDILPPRPKIRKTPQTPKKRRKNNLPFLFFLIILGAIVFLFYGLERPGAKINSSPLTAAPATSSPQGPKIKILNGTGEKEDLTKAQNALEKAGFPIDSTENALNLYDQTIIYYEEGYENEAQNIAEILGAYEAKIQKFTKITNYDLLIVIGQ